MEIRIIMIGPSQNFLVWRKMAVLLIAMLLSLGMNEIAIGQFDRLRNPYSVGDGPSSVFCADLDGDYDYDIVVANRFSDNVSVLKNNGDGTFQEAVNYDAGDGPYSICSANLDGDHQNDIITANSISNSISILENNGDGTFQMAVEYEVGEAPLAVCSEDFDGDGHPDLAVANYLSNNVSILKNNGDGTFGIGVDYDAGDGPISISCADIDGDGDADIVVANHNSDQISVLINAGNGDLQRPITYEVGGMPKSVFSADLDRDSDFDLVVANYLSDSVSVLLGNGDGTFEPVINYEVEDGPYSVYCADIDRDGDDDLAVANYHSDSASILKNLGDGYFQSDINYNVGDGPKSIFVADLDGDDDNDLVVADFNSDCIAVFINSCPAFCCDVEVTPDSNTIAVPPGGSFGLTGKIGNPTNEAILTDVWVGVKHTGGFYQVWFFPDIPLDPGQFLTYHFDQSVPLDAPLGNFDYVAYCGEYNSIRCDSSIFPFTVTGARLYGGATDWAIQRGWKRENGSTEIALSRNYPNPSKNAVTIKFDMPFAGKAQVEIYNLLGERVAAVVDEEIVAGTHQVNWDASSFSSGIYFYKLTIGDKVFTQRMTLLK